MLNKETNCAGCILEHTGRGFMKPSGTGSNGVMLVAEALNGDEAEAGKPFVGRAGFILDKLILRAGLNREEFYISNSVHCQPPNNKLNGMWYMTDALNHCTPYLDREIDEFHPRVIVTLGPIAFQRILPEIAAQRGVGLLDSKKAKGVVGYVFWSERYQCWVLPAVHPSFILRGQTAWAQSLIFCLQKAVDIAKDGYHYEVGDYTLDCTPELAHKWVDEFERYYYANPEVFLSCDIETPEKDGDEEDLNLEDFDNYIILRCGYSYRDGHGLSIPWDGPYRFVHKRLLEGPWNKCWWNGSYDQPRILSQDISIGGASHDGMDAWHILNSDLKKSLNFVTPWFRKHLKMWKHLSGAQPAFYNAVDADAAGSNLRGTIELLKKHDLFKVYKEFILELDPVYAAMTRAGMPISREKRIEASKLLTEKRKEVLAHINVVVPTKAKPITPKDGYKKVPKDTTGLVEVVFNGVINKYCSVCDLKDPKKGSHFKSKQLKQCVFCGQKWTKTHLKKCGSGDPVEVESNPCVNGKVIEREEGEKRWAKLQGFVPSTKGILTYQKVMKHAPIMVGKGEDRKATTDEKALKKLMGQHPTDQLYPAVLDFRELQTLVTRYIGAYESVLGNPYQHTIVGGFPVGRDGMVHGVFRHSPSTLRSSMVSPNLQNIPRGGNGGDDDYQKFVKMIFEAPDGYIFLERDFGGIEAVLVGYDAGSAAYYRLAKLDIHSYFTGHNLVRMGLLGKEDTPSLSWSDQDLVDYGQKIIKARFNAERDIGKRCIHAGNYRAGAKKLQEEYPKWFPKVKDAAAVLSFFYEVFPEIDQWHKRICQQVDKSTVIRNAFGHTHRFYQVLNWEQAGPDWQWSYGDDSKRLIAFGPQSNAALIGKRALKNCYYNYPQSVGQWLRLFIHDSIFCLVPERRLDEANSVLQFEMEKPIPELRLDPSWGFGDYVTIGSEAKAGKSWWGTKKLK